MHTFCSIVLIFIDFGYDWYSNNSVFKFLQEKKILFQIRLRTLNIVYFLKNLKKKLIIKYQYTNYAIPCTNYVMIICTNYSVIIHGKKHFILLICNNTKMETRWYFRVFQITFLKLFKIKKNKFCSFSISINRYILKIQYLMVYVHYCNYANERIFVMTSIFNQTIHWIT